MMVSNTCEKHKLCTDSFCAMITKSRMITKFENDDEVENDGSIFNLLLVAFRFLM